MKSLAIPLGRASSGHSARGSRFCAAIEALAVALLALLVGAPNLARATDVQAPPRLDETALQQQLLKAAVVAPKRGVFFEVSSASNTIYLFGTIHAGRADFYPLNSVIMRALAGSSRVVLELDFTDQTTAEKVATAGAYPPGMSLDRALSPELMQRLERAMSRYGVASEGLRRRKPWAITLELLSLESERLGYSSMFATDLYVAALAKLFDKPLSGLESADEQIAVLDGLRDEEQRATLEDTLAALDDGRAKAELESVVNAWASADSTALASSLAKARAAAPPAQRSLQRRVLDERNAIMAERIEAIVRSGQPAFVAVGSAHLVGPGSVVELLRKRGFSVREL
ncbi:MAG TPA: TraB/GumN family protein [Casimicrobiaceae bacterium]